nr:ATP-dependent Clp protease proteolytic subunit [Candidatus Brachybacter algidus]
MTSRPITEGADHFPQRADHDAAMCGIISVAQLLYLNSVESHRPVHLYIQSPGGIVYSGFAIYDTMRSMACLSVYTYAVGIYRSMATFCLVRA